MGTEVTHVAEDPERAAWRDLLAHLGACPDCLSGPSGCPAARESRAAWRAAEAVHLVALDEGDRPVRAEGGE